MGGPGYRDQFLGVLRPVLTCTHAPLDSRQRPAPWRIHASDLRRWPRDFTHLHPFAPALGRKPIGMQMSPCAAHPHAHRIQGAGPINGRSSQEHQMQHGQTAAKPSGDQLPPAHQIDISSFATSNQDTSDSNALSSQASTVSASTRLATLLGHHLSHVSLTATNSWRIMTIIISTVNIPDVKV